MTELKQNHLCQHFSECEDRSPSLGELAEADNIVSDALIYDAYAGVEFVSDDFSCTAA